MIQFLIYVRDGRCDCSLPACHLAVRAAGLTVVVLRTLSVRVRHRNSPMHDSDLDARYGSQRTNVRTIPGEWYRSDPGASSDIRAIGKSRQEATQAASMALAVGVVPHRRCGFWDSTLLWPAS